MGRAGSWQPAGKAQATSRIACTRLPVCSCRLRLAQKRRCTLPARLARPLTDGAWQTALQHRDLQSVQAVARLKPTEAEANKQTTSVLHSMPPVGVGGPGRGGAAAAIRLRPWRAGAVAPPSRGSRSNTHGARNATSGAASRCRRKRAPRGVHQAGLEGRLGECHNVEGVCGKTRGKDGTGEMQEGE